MAIEFETVTANFDKGDGTLSTQIAVHFPSDIRNVQAALQGFRIKPSGARELGELEVRLSSPSISGNKATCKADIVFYATSTGMAINEASCTILFIADCE